MRSPFRPLKVPDPGILDDYRPLVRQIERRGLLRGGLTLGALTLLTGFLGSDKLFAMVHRISNTLPKEEVDEKLKAVFFPLQQASYKAMAKMKLIAPKMQQLKELYGDDRQRLQKAMMELYQKEKVNPMAGCLPIIVQMPVFIALYWVILAAVELRHAPFYGWITDLSAIDPWYILPVLMGQAPENEPWM